MDYASRSELARLSTNLLAVTKIRGIYRPDRTSDTECSWGKGRQDPRKQELQETRRALQARG